MNNLVISLISATERRTHIEAEFGMHNISFNFFDAVTPAQIEAISGELNLSIARNTKLSLGEKACLLSHVCLWQKMIDEDIEYAGIFEDDIYLGENASDYLSEYDWIKSLGDHKGIVKLETFLEKVSYGKPNFKIKGRQLSLLKSPHSGAAGYSLGINECKTLLNLLRNTQPNEFIAVDHFLFSQHIKLPAYQLIPGVCVQSNRLEYSTKTFQSALEADRAEIKKTIPKEQRTLSDYLNKYKRSIGKRTIYRTVPFK